FAPDRLVDAGGRVAVQADRAVERHVAGVDEPPGDLERALPEQAQRRRLVEGGPALLAGTRLAPGRHLPQPSGVVTVETDADVTVGVDGAAAERAGRATGRHDLQRAPAERARNRRADPDPQDGGLGAFARGVVLVLVDRLLGLDDHL